MKGIIAILCLLSTSAFAAITKKEIEITRKLISITECKLEYSNPTGRQSSLNGGGGHTYTGKFNAIFKVTKQVWLESSAGELIEGTMQKVVVNELNVVSGTPDVGSLNPTERPMNSCRNKRAGYLALIELNQEE